MRISVYRKAHFNAAHRLMVKEWSDKENLDYFGKCSNPYYHGHNYDLEVKLTGEVDPKTGYLYDLGKLKDIIEKEIEERFDHKNLNEQCVEFKDINPTAENICYTIYQILRSKIEEKYDLSIKLWETSRNYVKYPA
jgi:6-pyruvoyltetrahydropterin/6-carboxytetrahydropterin synthase